MSPSSMIGDDMLYAHNLTDLSDYAVRVDEIEQGIIDVRYRRVMVSQRVWQVIEAMDNEHEKIILMYHYFP